ncbi:hypothetical protein LTR28_007039, partial [Elasticomyces elasticus]
MASILSQKAGLSCRTAFSCTSPVFVSVPCLVTPFSTTPKPRYQTAHTRPRTIRNYTSTQPLNQRVQPFARPASPHRHASTSAAPTTPPTPSSSLTWNRFLELRRTRRRINL